MMVPPIAGLVPAAIESTLDALRPFGNGWAPRNFLGGATETSSAWSEQVNAARAAAKAALDPEGLLRD
jgi:hypothetical protein